MKRKNYLFRDSNTASFMAWIGGSMSSQILRDWAPWWTSMLTPEIVLQPIDFASLISFVSNGL